MHAFLIIGKDQDQIKTKVDSLAGEWGAQLIEYPFAKIADVRGLQEFTRLSVTQPTAILLQDVDKTGEESVNAFLKNLEEPQKSLYYVLTAANEHMVLPTIVSRCQVMRITNNESKIVHEAAEKFLNMKAGERLAFLDKIKDREKATQFLEEGIEHLHGKLHESSADYSEIAKSVKAFTTAHTSLTKNGNVTLHLTKLIVELE